MDSVLSLSETFLVVFKPKSNVVWQEWFRFMGWGWPGRGSVDRNHQTSPSDPFWNETHLYKAKPIKKPQGLPHLTP